MNVDSASFYSKHSLAVELRLSVSKLACARGAVVLKIDDKPTKKNIPKRLKTTKHVQALHLSYLCFIKWIK